MIGNGLNIRRLFKPNQELMVKSLTLLLNAKDPPGRHLQENEETANGKLAGNTLMVSKTIENQDTGESHV